MQEAYYYNDYNNAYTRTSASESNVVGVGNSE